MSAPQPGVSTELSTSGNIFETIAVGSAPQVIPNLIMNSQSTEPTVSSSDATSMLKGTADEIPPPYAAVPPSWLWLREQDQAFVGVCIAVFLMVGGYHWVQLSGWGALPLEIDRQASRRYDYKIDINSAGLIEWTQIEGIGEITAQKILNDRDANGPFRNIDDLRRVKGIGPATVTKIRPYLRNDPSSKSAKLLKDSKRISSQP